MNLLDKILSTILFEKEPQKIGLSQIKNNSIQRKKEVSLKNKDVKLSDLMQRAI